MKVMRIVVFLYIFDFLQLCQKQFPIKRNIQNFRNCIGYKYKKLNYNNKNFTKMNNQGLKQNKSTNSRPNLSHHAMKNVINSHKLQQNRNVKKIQSKVSGEQQLKKHLFRPDHCEESKNCPQDHKQLAQKKSEIINRKTDAKYNMQNQQLQKQKQKTQIKEEKTCLGGIGKCLPNSKAQKGKKSQNIKQQCKAPAQKESAKKGKVEQKKPVEKDIDLKNDKVYQETRQKMKAVFKELLSLGQNINLRKVQKKQKVVQQQELRETLDEEEFHELVQLKNNGNLNLIVKGTKITREKSDDLKQGQKLKKSFVKVQKHEDKIDKTKKSTAKLQKKDELTCKYDTSSTICQKDCKDKSAQKAKIQNTQCTKLQVSSLLEIDNQKIQNLSFVENRPKKNNTKMIKSQVFDKKAESNKTVQKKQQKQAGEAKQNKNTLNKLKSNQKLQPIAQNKQKDLHTVRQSHKRSKATLTLAENAGKHN